MKTNTLLELSPNDISEQDGFNTRYDLGDLRELKSSMSLKGFDKSEPLIVRIDPDNKSKYILGAQGHRRLTAAKELELDMVFAVLEDENLSDSDRNLDIVRLNSGEPLPQLAVARVVERALQDVDLTQAAVAKLLGKSPTFIGDCLKLNKCTKQTQKRIEQDRISAREVVDIVNELEAKTEEGFAKVEERVEKLIEKAGEKKVTKKVKAKAEKEEDETDAEREEREAAEAEEKDAKEKQKSRTKELIAIEKRVKKYSEDIQAMVIKTNDLPKDDLLTPFQSALLDFQVSIASFLMSTPTDSSRLFTDRGDAAKMSDIGSAQRTLEKVHKETLKETVSEVKAEAKETVEAVKAQVKATKEEAAKRIKAVKEAAKA